MLKKLCCIVSMLTVALCISATLPAAAWTRCGIPDSIVDRLIADFYKATTSVHDISLFTPKLMWAAIVDRDGRLCAIVKSGDAWPGSRAIAIAKASTANDFSNDKLALSTARLYGPTIPEGSLYGLNTSNPFNFLVNDPHFPAIGTVPGGIITFGGGVPLYLGGKVIGGFGVSGDTACADHDVAYITRRIAIGQGIVSDPVTPDNILYANGPPVPGSFTHPHCLGGEQAP